MLEIVCKNCGSNDFEQDGRNMTCRFCGSKFILDKEHDSVKETTIALNEDVVQLLHRWRENPAEGDKYAKLILQIDPNNKQALQKIGPSSDQRSNSGGCYIATAVYGSYDCPPVWVLRRFRDRNLASTWYGRIFIRCYYAVSPTFVKWFGQTEWFNRIWKARLDRLVEKLRDEGIEDIPYQD